MARSGNKGKSGHEPQPSKQKKTTTIFDASYQEPKNQRKRTGRTFATSAQAGNKRKRVTPTPLETSESGSDAEDESSDQDDEDGEEEDDDADEPLVFAPLPNDIAGQTGLYLATDDFDDAASDGIAESAFSVNFQMPENEVLVDSGDDEIYNAVDNISDSDTDDGILNSLEEQQILADFTEQDFDQTGFLNHVEGLSDFGDFGYEEFSDGTAQFPVSSQGSDDEVILRRVHFETVPSPPQLTSSPTITRALLPSALSENFGLTSVRGYDSDDSSSDDAYDSETTNVADPPDDIQRGSTGDADLVEDLDEPAPLSARAASKRPARKGPPMGTFIDEGLKTSGIMATRGNRLLMTDPHLLGQDFARLYGNSAPASPSAGVFDIGAESEAGSSLVQNHRSAASAAASTAAEIAVNALMGDATPSASASTGISTAYPFVPASDFYAGNYLPDDAESLNGDDELIMYGENNFDVDDLIKYDDSDSSSNDESSIFVPPKMFKKPNDIPSYVGNPTAFRKNTASSFKSSDSTSIPRSAQLSTPHRAPKKRKRKHAESPYSSAHYAGVTPVQRIMNRNATPATPPSSAIQSSPAKKLRFH